MSELNKAADEAVTSLYRQAIEGSPTDALSDFEFRLYVRAAFVMGANWEHARSAAASERSEETQ